MDGMSQREFQNYLGLLGRLLRLRSAQRKAIEEELRTHMEERFAALTSQGIGPEQAVSLALAEFGDAAALAAEFTAISRLQKRRWMMRFTIASIAATILLTAVVVSLWPDGSGKLADTLAQAQQVEKPAPPKTEEPPPKPDANVWTQFKLEAHGNAEFEETPLKDVLAYLADLAKVQIYVDRASLEEAGVTAENSMVTINLKDVPAEMILRLVLRQHKLAYMLDNGVAIVTTPQEVENELDIRVYSVRDLVQQAGKPETAEPGPSGARAEPSPTVATGSTPGLAWGSPRAPIAPQNHLAALIELITTTVEPTSWDEAGGPGNIHEYRGALVIAQTQRVHRKVEKLLRGLRDAIEK